VLLEPQRQSSLAQVRSLGAFEGNVSLGMSLVHDGKVPFRVAKGDDTLTIEFDYGPSESGRPRFNRRKLRRSRW